MQHQLITKLAIPLCTLLKRFHDRDQHGIKRFSVRFAVFAGNVWWAFAETPCTYMSEHMWRYVARAQGHHSGTFKATSAIVFKLGYFLNANNESAGNIGSRAQSSLGVCIICVISLGYATWTWQASETWNQGSPNLSNMKEVTLQRFYFHPRPASSSYMVAPKSERYTAFLLFYRTYKGALVFISNVVSNVHSGIVPHPVIFVLFFLCQECFLDSMLLFLILLLV